MAMARRDSVTVSIAAETSGMFSEIFRVNCVCVLTSVGRTEDFPGTSSTSSNVNPSRIGPSIHFSLNDKKTAPKYNTAQRQAAGRKYREHSRPQSFMSEFSFYARRRAKSSALGQVGRTATPGCPSQSQRGLRGQPRVAVLLNTGRK